MPALALAPTPPDAPIEVLPGLAELIARELTPQVIDIDQKGVYPGDFLKQLGALGGLGSLTPLEHGGTALGLGHAIRVIEEASKECVSTGFLLWAEYALQWYVINSSNRALAAEMLPIMARGEVLGGTAQSNSMKSCVGIEEARLKAARVDGGYVINGVLPWVSNIGPEHVFHMGARLPDTPGLVIGLMHGSTPGLTLMQNAHFIGMEGTNTFACQFRDVFLPDSRVVCHAEEFDAFRDRTKSAFILLQMGMGLGLVDACVNMMTRADRQFGHVNRFLDVQADALQAELDAARAATYALADRIERDGSAPHVRETLEVRLAGSELSLKAANAAMLHMGAKGYLSNNAAQRRLREAYFIAIVTPAIKHLRKELHEFDTHDCALAQPEREVA
ncbi:MAG: acyl-CoA dehydrogenase family protein [Thiobacillus sp.]|uniref:acyl-CoA dehydrogenase family protein n=1 Tax=Thiobacillus sp. TaxID=924 RepID=UPI002735C20F|nr:acyl-CoA dehydrogenase family protein [Thiobacillus sp.]MDP3585009.1 acyl-CoA dehydrogenase family protein [Thiobacillus sp.]